MDRRIIGGFIGGTALIFFSLIVVSVLNTGSEQNFAQQVEAEPNVQQSAIRFVIESYKKVSSTAGGFVGVLADGDEFGIRVSEIADLNNDGVNEIAVGAWRDDDGGADQGAIWILFMNADGTVASEQKISETQGGFIGPLDTSDEFGIAIADLGDLDGDGVEDIAVGARGDDDGGTNRGAVYILFLNADGTVKAEQKISSISGGLVGPIDNTDLFGNAVTNIGDVDGDSIVDIVVTAIQDDDGGADRGTLWILNLDTDGTVLGEAKINQLNTPALGLADADRFGHDVAVIGDLNGDGVDDWAVGTARDDDGGADRGAVHILFMAAGPTVSSVQKISDLAGGFNGTLDNDDRFGATVAALGDVNNDGVFDIASGAWHDDDGGADRGAVYLLFLQPDGTVGSFEKISDLRTDFTGNLDDDDRFGLLIDAADIDQNGFVELLIGASHDDDGGADRGAFYIAQLGLYRTNPILVLPTGSVEIHAGEACVTSSDVLLTLRAERATEVLISNNARFSESRWEPFTGSEMSRTWQLDPGDGERTVYVLYRDSGLNMSLEYRDAITVDAVGNCGILPTETEDEEDLIPAEPVEREPGIPLVDRNGLPIGYGSYIKTPTSKAVYWLDETLRARPFVSEIVYFTWEDSFAPIVTVDQEVFDTLVKGPFMTFKPGSVLVKLPLIANVYYLAHDGDQPADAVLRWVENEPTAAHLFGSDWADYVIDIEAREFLTMRTGDVLRAGDVLLDRILDRTRDMIGRVLTSGREYLFTGE